MTWTPVPLIKTTAEFFAGKGVPSPRLDAEVLLCHALEVKNRLELYTGFERPLTSTEVDAYRKLVRRRARREPVSHILGYRDFMGIRFKVTPDVLAPRPETEIMVEQAVRLLERQTGEKGQNPDTLQVLDLGTGSGCIAVSLAAMCPSARVTATDISAEALRVAEENAHAAGVQGRVDFRHGDLFAACRPGESFDLLLSNPPYVAENDPQVWPEVRDFEPAVAVFSPGDVLSFYKRIASEAEKWLNPGSWLLMELGADQARSVSGILTQTTLLQDIGMVKDHNNIERVIMARKPEQ